MSKWTAIKTGYQKLHFAPILLIKCHYTFGFAYGMLPQEREEAESKLAKHMVSKKTSYD